MELYTTTIKAICPKSGELKTYCGQHVPGISFEDAQNYCDTNELGYCKVEGLLVMEIMDDETEIDYEKIKMN